ncbi:MAG: hypothetical protein HKP58_14075 [Desulfatitalea sp.]|nr:hypothetical protein [Desulfatitalea sp.]NNK01531.1 hypothetical protein [Desulfatitalea sp.]
MQPVGLFFNIGQSKGLLRRAFAALALSVMIGCGGGGGDTSSGPATGGDDTASQTAFPTALAVASPLDLNADAGTSGMSRAISRAVPADSTGSRYGAAITAVNDLLTETSISACTFDPELFFQAVINAGCYGPSVQYEDHPDNTSIPNSGELPPGDTGIWLELDPTTGDACAAAELNARMAGIQARSLGALLGLASMVCTINASGGALSLPDATNPSVDLTSALPAPTGVTFNSAILTYATTSASEAKYAYSLDFDYSTHHIVVELAHIPDTTSADFYRGQLTYRISATTDWSNCPMVSGSTPVTRNGSLVYNRTAGAAMTMEMREAQFCGTDTDGLDTDKVVDAAKKFDPISEPEGWGDDFNLFRTDFDPTTQLGNYAYFWQAGHHDGNTRVFNLRVYDDGREATEDLNATAFFGFGSDAGEADPSIQGFIFNWAGPGNNHTLQEYAQKQQVSYNSGTGKFDSASANIAYAPTTTGNYDGTGSFTYDSDADGSVDTDPADPITHDLAVSSDDGTGTYSIEQTITDAGIIVPGQPSCSECAP